MQTPLAAGWFRGYSLARNTRLPVRAPLGCETSAGQAPLAERPESLIFLLQPDVRLKSDLDQL
jgi:hypothetical protein